LTFKRYQDINRVGHLQSSPGRLLPDSKKERGALQYFCDLKSRHSIPTSKVLLVRELEMVVFSF